MMVGYKLDKIIKRGLLMEIAILDAITFGDTSLEGFNQFGDVTIYKKTSPAETLNRVKETDIIVTNKVIISKEIMIQSKSLKLICIAATGMNNVDLEAAKELQIEVKNVAGYSTASVVQHTFAMAFYLLEHSKYYDEKVKTKAYSKSQIFTDVSKPFYEIKNKKWGIIGLGEIGRNVAKVASAFGSEVLYYSTSKKNNNKDYTRVKLDELLKECNIISIHAPLNENTKNLLDYKELDMCKDKAIVLNLGRGGIINEEAVAKIVDKKDIYIGLDVFEKEPLSQESPLFTVTNKDRLHLTPHIAWTSKEAREKLIDGIIKNIKQFLKDVK
jgi:glycerate dehydrogenase